MTPEERERYVRKTSLELLKGCSPDHNMIPTMDVVRAAYFLGYGVVKLSPTTGESRD